MRKPLSKEQSQMIIESAGGGWSVIGFKSGDPATHLSDQVAQIVDLASMENLRVREEIDNVKHQDPESLTSRINHPLRDLAETYLNYLLGEKRFTHSLSRDKNGQTVCRELGMTIEDVKKEEAKVKEVVGKLGGTIMINALYDRIDLMLDKSLSIPRRHCQSL